MPLGRGRHARGFLLVEATLTVAVLAVGLVFIARGLGENLRVLRSLEERQLLLDLAESKFAELEVVAQRIPLAVREGVFEAPHQPYRWQVTGTDVPSPDLPDDLTSAVRLVTLTVSPARRGAGGVRLQTIWPVEWLP